MARDGAARVIGWQVGDFRSLGHGARGQGSRVFPWAPGAEAMGQDSWKGSRLASPYKDRN